MSLASIKSRKAKAPESEPQESPIVVKARRRAISAARPDEMKRVLSLPVTFHLSDSEVDEFSRERLLRSAYDDGKRLLPSQATGLYELELFDGLFAPIPVGKGKTLLSLMVANHWLTNGHERGLLVIPPEVLGQLVQTDIQFARRMAPIGYQIHVLGGRSLQVRRGMAASKRPGLYILPYSMLSTKDTDENLSDIAPTFIIADEAHRVASPRAARTKRLFQHYIDEHKPKCAFLSGTITSKTIKDYAHLSRAALRENNFLPNIMSQAEEWGQVIDTEPFKWTEDKGEEPTVRLTTTLQPLVDWAKERFPDEEFDATISGVRKAYKMRMMTAPGVVADSGDDIGTTLTISNRPVENSEASDGWGTLQALIDKLQQQYLTPNGDEVDHAMHVWKWMYELSSGFYNELVWPVTGSLAERRRIGESEAEALLERSRAHHDKEQEYTSLLREWLTANHRPRLDTPMLVGLDMARHGSENVGEELFEAWRAMKDADFEGRVVRDSNAVRVCPYKIDAAIEWAKKNHRGIVWVHHIELGQWIADRMREAGMDPLHCPAGDAANNAIRDMGNKDRIVVASMSAHGTGKNLQHFDRSLFVQWPRAAKSAEQILGRLHRTGQTADEVVNTTLNTSQFDDMNLAACINDAIYIHQTTGSRQKLVYAQYDPVPRIFPSEFLRERGAEVKILTAEQREMLKDKFG